MFGWLKKHPLDRLKLEYARKLENARDLQRRGDLIGYSRVTSEAEEILAKIEQAEFNSTAE